MAIFTGSWYSPLMHEFLQFSNPGYDSYSIIDRIGEPARTITTTLMPDNSTIIIQGHIKMVRLNDDFIVYNEAPYINIKRLIDIVSHSILIDAKFNYEKFHELKDEDRVDYIKSSFYSMNALPNEFYNNVYYNIVRLKLSSDLNSAQMGFRNFMKLNKDYLRMFFVTVPTI